MPSATVALVWRRAKDAAARTTAPTPLTIIAAETTGSATPPAPPAATAATTVNVVQETCF